MDNQSAAEIYRTSSIENAPPTKIIRLLFEGALRFLERAAAEDSGDPHSQFLYYVDRADAIVTELRLAIDQEVVGDLPSQLESLYLFCEGELGAAKLERSPGRLDGVRGVLERLLDGWRHVEADSGQPS